MSGVTFKIPTFDEAKNEYVVIDRAVTDATSFHEFSREVLHWMQVHAVRARSDDVDVASFANLAMMVLAKTSEVVLASRRDKRSVQYVSLQIEDLSVLVWAFEKLSSQHRTSTSSDARSADAPLRESHVAASAASSGGDESSPRG